MVALQGDSKLKIPKFTIEDDFLEIKGTVFDEQKIAYKKLKKDMMDKLINTIVKDFKDLTKSYLKKTFAKPEESALTKIFDLSPEICDALSQLKERMDAIQKYLNKDLLSKFWKCLAQHLNNYIFNSVILAHNFGYSGALQFNHDMKALFLLWRPYTSNPENYFKEVKESIVILTLPDDTLQPLKAKVDKILNKMQEVDEKEVIKSLENVGIFKLNINTVKTITSLRV